jgi:hypothetical protein
MTGDRLTERNAPYTKTAGGWPLLNFCTSTFVAYTGSSAATLPHESIPGREPSRRPEQSAQDTGGME